MQTSFSYLDNNATTPVAPEVFAAMQPYLTSEFGNPSSIHRLGGTARRAVEEARDSVAALLGAQPSEILFTSSGTEGDNTALGMALPQDGSRGRLITTRVEHPAVLSPALELQRRGHTVVQLAVDEGGQLDMAALDAELERGANLVSMMWANNETGVLFPIAEAAARAKARGILFHTDAVQAIGKVAVDVRQVPVDMLTLSGHKLHAPKGIGALYVRQGTPLRRFMDGGHQENGRRGGTENVPGIVALGEAARLAREHLAEENTRVRALRDRLERTLLSSCPNARLNGSEQRLPNTTNISFEFVEGESILLLLDEQGVAASSGSACTSGSLEPSHVLRSMRVPQTFAHGAIRFSLSRMNNDADVDRVIAAMPTIIERLRALSPFGRSSTPAKRSAHAGV